MDFDSIRLLLESLEEKLKTLKDAIKYQLPFAGATCALFLGIILVWYIVGMPLGVGTSVAP